MPEWVQEKRVRCPFCDEPVTLVIDTSAGGEVYTEDCQVCCQPMLIETEAADGELVSLRVGRGT